MRMYNEQGVDFAESKAVFDDRKLSPSQKKIVDEVVTKSVELNNLVIKNKNVSNHNFCKALEEFEFSESIVDFVDKQAYQFAEPSTPFIIDNWTAASLNMVVQQVGSEMNKDTTLNLAFPDKSVPYDKVLLDRIAPNSGILPEFAGDSSSLPTVRQLDKYGLEYKSGLWAGRCPIMARDIFFAREQGRKDFGSRGIGQIVAYNSVNLINQAMTRKKYLVNQAIFNNSFQYAGGNIVSNIPSQNYIQMYEPMGVLNNDGSVTYASSDPLYTPLIAITNILSNPLFLIYQRYIRGIILNGMDLQAIMNQQNVKAVTNFFTAANNSLGTRKMSLEMGGITKEVLAYYAPSFDFPLIGDYGVWLPQDTYGNADYNNQQYFVPRGAMYVLLDLTEMGGQNGAFHLTYNMVDPNIEAPSTGLFNGVFNRNLQNSDTVNRLDIVSALSGAPAVYMPEAQHILTGLYSNISQQYR